MTVLSAPPRKEGVKRIAKSSLPLLAWEKLLISDNSVRPLASKNLTFSLLCYDNPALPNDNLVLPIDNLVLPFENREMT